MKIIAVEEHMVTPAVLTAWAEAPEAAAEGIDTMGEGEFGSKLLDLDQLRLEVMNALGVDVHVLSLTSPGVQNINGTEALTLAQAANDTVAEAIARHPDRFEGFATLPTSDPSAAADELRRAITSLGFKGVMLNGRTGERNVEDRSFDELYSTVTELGVPLYIHPRTPVAGVREAYYEGLGPISGLFSRPGIGWHFETGIQVLRLILGGTFDRHPDLQVVLGHWGEVVLFYVERIANMDRMGTKLDRPIADYLRQNVYYTPSGMLSQRYLRWTLELVEADRIMFSTDYPFVPLKPGAATSFVEEAPLSDADREKFSHGNWELLTGHLGAGA